eukprot:gene12232-biopygen4921
MEFHRAGAGRSRRGAGPPPQRESAAPVRARTAHFARCAKRKVTLLSPCLLHLRPARADVNSGEADHMAAENVASALTRRRSINQGRAAGPPARPQGVLVSLCGCGGSCSTCMAKLI